MSFRRWALVVGLIGLALVLLLALGPGSVEVAQMGHPDWTTKTEVVNSELYVTVLNSSLDVNVTNSTIAITPANDAVFTISPEATAIFQVSGSVDANITNSTLNVNVTNTSLDVNVTNSSLSVTVHGTADVEIQNAELNVRNLREQVVDVGDLAGFADSTYVPSVSGTTVTVWTNTQGKTVYLEYFTVAVEVASSSAPQNSISPTAISIKMRVKDSAGNTLFELYSNGQMFLNLDPAPPIPDGAYIEVSISNASSANLFVNIAGIIRLI